MVKPSLNNGLKEVNNYTIRELSKNIASTNIMSSGSNTSFVKLAAKLIQHLQSGADLEKISRIVSRELISSYGLDITEENGIEIAEDIFLGIKNDFKVQINAS